MNSRIAIALAAVGLLISPNVPVALAQAQRTPVSGIIDSAAADRLTLADGTMLTLAPDTRVTLSRSVTPADLQPGMFIAITAIRDMDDALLASIISVFPESGRGREGQFPLTADNLMTNANIEEATIDEVGSTELSVSFNGQNERVRLAPDARVSIRQNGTTDDLQPGSRADVFVTDGVATNVTVFLP